MAKKSSPVGKADRKPVIRPKVRKEAGRKTSRHQADLKPDSVTINKSKTQKELYKLAIEETR
ncbi:MAG: hypothetical protein HY863_08620, partial [Chloroflexi bacterium]|nr:hypothetical protein [Chloroflexota bacterium]